MSTKRALIVATRDYEDPKFPSLPSATADAEALARVLEDPRIGAFDVDVIQDGSAVEIKRAMEALFSRAKRDDLLLLHLSCHGLRSITNRLYFIANNTERDFLGSTAIEADFVNDQMEQSASRRVMLFLDCCFSGAFSHGFRPRADSSENVDVNSSLSGRGRLVITASTALQFAYERDSTDIFNVELVRPALFTEAIVRGLETGEADKDGDGRVSVNELYDYVFEQVTTAAPGQTPTMSGDRAQGTIYLARSPRGPRSPQDSLHSASGPVAQKVVAEPRIQSVQIHDSSGRANNEIHKYDQWTVVTIISLKSVAAEGKSFLGDYEIRLTVVDKTLATAREIAISEDDIVRSGRFPLFHNGVRRRCWNRRTIRPCL